MTQPRARTVRRRAGSLRGSYVARSHPSSVGSMVRSTARPSRRSSTSRDHGAPIMTLIVRRTLVIAAVAVLVAVAAIGIVRATGSAGAAHTPPPPAPAAPPGPGAPAARPRAAAGPRPQLPPA